LYKIQTNDKRGTVEDQAIFVGGVVVGILALTVISFVTARINLAWHNITTRHVPDGKKEPKRSCLGVVGFTSGALLAWVFWFLVLLVLLGALGYGAYVLFTF
jgi:hypothetical protein